MIFEPSIDLGSPGCEHMQYRYFVFLKEWQYPVIQNVSGSNGMFAGVQLGKGNSCIGINDSLLIYPAHTLDRT